MERLPERTRQEVQLISHMARLNGRRLTEPEKNVGIASGWVSGYLGALLAMKQFGEQRAFDRQLEWYERTIRILGEMARFVSRLSKMQPKERLRIVA